jgi:tetratricopeptide (TPR) repeat protein
MKVKELKSGLERIINKQPVGVQVSAKPGNSDVSFALMAKANLEAGRYTDAEFDINRALQANDDITYKFIKGKILYHEGRYSEAKTILEPLTNGFKTSELFKYIGLCDYGMRDYTGALMNLDKAIILSDEDKTLEAKYNEIKRLL